MVDGSGARVIPLRSDRSPGETARARQRELDKRRHPSSVVQLAATTSTDGFPTVVRHIEAVRPDVGSAEKPPRGHGFAGRAAAIAEFVRRRLTGDYDVDEFGFDPQFNDVIVLPLLRLLYGNWFRVETSGIHNLPSSGPALLVLNHAGVLPVDALMVSVAVHDEHPAHRTLRVLAADMVFETAMLGPVARKAGHTRACVGDVDHLLSNGELTAVFPEGYKGLGKCFRDRYRLARFGRGGFVAAALRTGVPIIPCSVIGSEEIYPMLAELPALARVLGLPYFPVTVGFPLAGPIGLIPVPSKWHIEFGSPIPTRGYGSAAAEDPMLVYELSDHVRETIQCTLYRLLTKRRNVFQGCSQHADG